MESDFEIRVIGSKAGPHGSGRVVKSHGDPIKELRYLEIKISR
jgi:hypothetical protein